MPGYKPARTVPGEGSARVTLRFMDVDRHLEAFNEAVRTGDWPRFAQRFSEDAEMRFVGVPVGPFAGRDEIEGGYLADPPDDTISRTAEPRWEGDEQVVPFQWDGTGQTGTMRFVWSSDGLVRSLTVSYD